MTEIQMVMETISKLGDAGADAFKWYLISKCFYYLMTVVGFSIPSYLAYRVGNYAVHKAWEDHEEVIY